MKSRLFIITLLALLVIGCTREPLPEPEREGGKIVTISATIPPETRVLYDDTDLSLTWQTGDTLLLAGYDGTTYKGSEKFHWTGGNSFRGTDVLGANIYKAYYLVEGITLNETTGEVQLPDNFWEQTQNGNNSTAHLRNHLLLFDEQAHPINQIFNLVAKSSIIKLNLSGIPQEVGALRKLIYTVETAPGVFKSVPLNVTDVTFSAALDNITAFLSFDPTVMTNTAAGGKVIIRLKGNKLYQWSQSVALGKDYAAGNRYKGTVSSDWADITTPLYYVAEYNVTQDGDGFVTDLTSCSGSGYFTWSEAFDLFNNTTTIGGVNYHWPSDQEWFGIVPKYVKTGYYVHFKTEYSYNNIYESVKVRSEYFNVYGNVRTTPNNISYAIRYRNNVWYSAWRYEYITDGNNTHMKITSRKVATSVDIDAIAQESFWNSGNENDIVRYFPAGGYGSSSYQGERGFFWSSTEHSSNNSYAWYMLFNTDRAYTNNTPKIFSITVRLFYD